MTKKFIKMNDNKNYLSLGNLFNIIKNYANNKETAMQTEIFCAIFKVSHINNTTVNNYCIGYRAIGIEYKKKFIDIYNKYKKDKLIFLDILLSIISILDEHIYILDNNSIELINSNNNLRKVILKSLEIANNDININEDFINKINKFLKENNLYEAFINILHYVILENIQPIYNQTINIKINEEELNDYLKINLYEGISYITSLKKLSKKDNMFANAELGSLEFSGLINGSKRVDESFKYYMKAAKKNHPKACWMVANLILTNRVPYNYDTAFLYLNKAIEFGSIAALNTMGNCYRLGINKKIDLDKAKEYYLKASENGYVYAFNNLGIISELEKNEKEAFKYYTISADMGESWASNKVGEMLRKNNNLEEAYIYYINSSEAPINEKNYYSYYNLAKYYYLVGNKSLNIKKDINKAKEYLIIAKENGIKEAKDLLDKLN